MTNFNRGELQYIPENEMAPEASLNANTTSFPASPSIDQLVEEAVVSPKSSLHISQSYFYFSNDLQDDRGIIGIYNGDMERGLASP
jgi:hypothetical protein